MPFPYDRVTGPIDLENDSDAIQDYKAGTGALVYALRKGGWSDEQIVNALSSHFDAVSDVLAEHIADLQENEPSTPYAAGMFAAETAIRPLPYAVHCQCFRCDACPCRPHYCNACFPEENRP